MRSEANFRRSECQPRPRLGSSPASFWALSHQTRTRDRSKHREGSLGAGNTGEPPPLGFRIRASFRTASTSAVTGVRCSYPVFSFSARQRMILASMSMSDQQTTAGVDPSKKPHKLNQDYS